MSQLYSIRRKTEYGTPILYINLDEHEVRRIFLVCHYERGKEFIADPDGNDVTNQIMSGCTRITEHRFLDAHTVSGLCIEHNWYTRGSNKEFFGMMQSIRENTSADAYSLYGIAKNIVEHSHMENSSKSIGEVMVELSKACWFTFEIEEENK